MKRICLYIVISSLYIRTNYCIHINQKDIVKTQTPAKKEDAGQLNDQQTINKMFEVAAKTRDSEQLKEDDPELDRAFKLMANPLSKETNQSRYEKMAQEFEDEDDKESQIQEFGLANFQKPLPKPDQSVLKSQNNSLQELNKTLNQSNAVTIKIEEKVKMNDELKDAFDYLKIMQQKSDILEQKQKEEQEAINKKIKEKQEKEELEKKKKMESQQKVLNQTVMAKQNQTKTTQQKQQIKQQQLNNFTKQSLIKDLNQTPLLSNFKAQEPVLQNLKVVLQNLTQSNAEQKQNQKILDKEQKDNDDFQKILEQQFQDEENNKALDKLSNQMRIEQQLEEDSGNVAFLAKQAHKIEMHSQMKVLDEGLIDELINGSDSNEQKSIAVFDQKTDQQKEKNEKLQKLLDEKKNIENQELMLKLQNQKKAIEDQIQQLQKQAK